MSYSISTWKSLAAIHHIMSVSARLGIIHTSTEAYTCLGGINARALKRRLNPSDKRDERIRDLLNSVLIPPPTPPYLPEMRELDGNGRGG